MGKYGSGLIEIPLEDFWDFVRKTNPVDGNVVYGVPRTNKDNDTIEIDYVFNTEISPTDEVGYKDSVVRKQWFE